MSKTDIEISIYTPTYNRSNLIGNLFDSLMQQSCKRFEWLIYDDSEDDKTEKKVNIFRKNADFNVKYTKRAGNQERGISRSFNRMLKDAQGRIVFKVDDDDILHKDAVQIILEIEKTISDKSKYAGVAGLRNYKNGAIIGGEWRWPQEYLDATNLERERFHLTGDKAEAYYTSVLRKYGPMPTVSGESYTWEAVLWDRIGHAGLKIRWFNKAIYTTEYLPGGLTAIEYDARECNFKTYTILISERMNYSELGWLSRFLSLTRYCVVMRKKNLTPVAVKKNFERHFYMLILAYYTSIVLVLKNKVKGMV